MLATFQKNKDYLLLLIFLFLNFLVWIYSHEKMPKWANVPLAPSAVSATISFLGDKEVAYRSLALTLQSFGNGTGQVQALKDYNYNNLATWFYLEDDLNVQSNYVPFLAAYYFSASQDPSKIRPLIEYLRVVGMQPGPDKWRYLGQAVLLARHKLNDMNLALSLADDLAKTYKPGMPAWPLQMRAIIASGMGEKEMAYNMMVDALQNQKEGLDPIEVNYMVDQICNHLLSKDKAKENSLCQ